MGNFSLHTFDEENIKVLRTKSDMNISRDIFQIYNNIVDSINNKVEEVIILDNSTDFVYELFPTLLKWKIDGAIINVILKNNNDNEKHGPYRRRFLESFGCHVFTEDTIPFKGVIINGNAQNALAVIIEDSPDGNFAHAAQLYTNKDNELISILRSEIISMLRIKTNTIYLRNSNYQPSIRSIAHNEIFTLLKNVSQYKNASFSVAKINIREILFLTKYVRGYKYRQIRTLVKHFTETGLNLFEPAKLILKDEKYTVICPPILESHSNDLYVIEGNTRLTYCYRNGIEEAFVIVVNNVNVELPSSDKVKVNEVVLTDITKIGKDRYNNFDYKKFRDIERSVRNPSVCLL
ncbi:hypothetical protein QNI16_00090 [Cytophagaceae bacterium YF14B1]|uniref:Inactive HKD-Rease domain-containing protein n=1 Tax=Xanthocytophaga flava TaxID=3048013 RepID=A0AAE3QGD0_9BACT|nr:hypothetical protein [Xanthocytophaga flavus]MDJ1478857.1 hypothetical protein [Xanthocytophaga flavus]